MEMFTMKKSIFSPRQIEVLDYLTEGLTVNEIADYLDISSRMVDVHISAAQKKLSARTREHAVYLYTKKYLTCISSDLI